MTCSCSCNCSTSQCQTHRDTYPAHLFELSARCSHSSEPQHGVTGYQIPSQTRKFVYKSWLVTLLVLISISSLPTPINAMREYSLSQAEELKGCINAGYKFARTTWNASVLNDTIPNMRVEKMWWSQKPRTIEFTVITQLTPDRTHALFNQCTTYTGPLSAAVYLPLVQTEEEGGDRELSQKNRQAIQSEVARLSQLFDRVESEDGMCQLDLMLLTEVFDSAEAALLYPVNALRNFARMQARTDLLSAIDVDMLISTSLSTELAVKENVDALIASSLQRTVTVLPAFEPTRMGMVGRALAEEAAVVDKNTLFKMFKGKKVQQFKIKVFTRGHTPSDYPRFFNSSQPYPVRYRFMYEPWFITHWDMLPWFDVNFRGYGLNKIVHVASLNFYDIKFQVHPSAWLVHRPHEDTSVRKLVARQASDVNKLKARLPRTALYSKVTTLFGEAKRAMIRGDYTPRLHHRMVQCFDALDWLPRMPLLEGKPVDATLFL